MQERSTCASTQSHKAILHSCVKELSLSLYKYSTDCHAPLHFTRNDVKVSKHILTKTKQSNSGF